MPIFTIRAALPVNASAHDIALMNASQQAQQFRATITLLALAAVSLVVGWLIAGRFLRPLRTITATARDISASNLNRRLVPGARDDEFAELGDTLNGLFGRLEGAFESQRRFVANASHELRTPLSAGRALLQVAVADPDATVDSLKAACQEVLDLGDQQEHLIAALLTLASSQRGLARAEPLDLADLTGKVLVAREDEAARRHLQVTAALDPALTTGDPALAESLIANLADNALRHNHPHGRGGDRHQADRRQAPSYPCRNTGPVIPPAEVAALFEPFRQFGEERVQLGDGYGLGLAIVRAIADAHTAQLTAHSNPDRRPNHPGHIPPRRGPGGFAKCTRPGVSRRRRLRGVRGVCPPEKHCEP